MPAADRPKRNTKAPTSFPVAPPPSSKSRNTGSGSWTTAKVLTKASGITNTDTPQIQSFLSQCIISWDIYSLEDQRLIINTLPPTRRLFLINPETQKFTCPLDAAFIATDPHIKRGVTRFKEDLENGCYTATWQRQARQAMREREEGRFDEYLAHHIEDNFGDPIGDDDDPYHMSQENPAAATPEAEDKGRECSSPSAFLKESSAE